jgi:membrane-associated phospholipid phosphatase
MAKQKVRQARKALMKADRAAAEAAAPYRRSAMVKALAWASELGDQPQMLSLSGGVLAIGLIGRNRRMAGAGARMIAAHLLATLAKNFVKHRIDRSRPRSAAGRDGHRLKPGRSEAKEKTSFPSGHSAGAIAVARAFTRYFPEHKAAALGSAGAIALIQIPRSAHYPTDVAAGLAIGLAAEKAIDAIWPG